MTTFYLDTEFNGFGGKLISLALVSPDGDEWYECMESADSYDEWVAQNVIPKLGKAPISKAEFGSSLRAFVSVFYRPTIFCDWHTDLIHFFACLEGDRFTESVPFEGTANVIQTPEGQPRSDNPHNALSDAYALMEWHRAHIS